MRAVVGDEEDQGIVLDVVFFEGVYDLFDGIVHLVQVIAIATWGQIK